MENNALSQTSPLIERRRLLLAGGALLLSPVLARFNGSLGSNKYPNAVIGAWRNRWQWAG